MDNQEKQKRDKQYQTEWSFSFDNMGERISEMFSGFSEDAEPKMASFSEAKDNAQSASINLNFSVGETTVKPLVASDNLFEADLTFIGEVDFKAVGEGQKNITLKQKSENPIARSFKQAFGSLSHGKDLRWDVRLSPDIPLSLNIHGGVGKGELDLEGLNLTHFTLDTGVGKNDIALPESAAGYDVNIKGGVGETIVDLPVNTSLTMKINAGVGAVRLNLPANVALRVKAKGGIGNVSVPENMERISGGTEFVSVSGVWQTRNYDAAAHQITVDYNGGVGELKIASDVTVV